MPNPDFSYTHCFTLLFTVDFDSHYCQDYINFRNHYRVVVKVFASGSEISLGARVRIPIGADVGVMPTVHENIFMSFSTIKTEK